MIKFSMKILLLEDDKQLNNAITTYLKLKNYTVDSFFDGETVMNNLGGYDLYLLDINTPNISGLEILTYLNKITRVEKVIMISANIQVDILKQAYDNGCYDYLKKPFQIEELFFKIQRIEKEIIYKTSLKSDINLTKKELSLYTLLEKNKKSIVTYAQIELHIFDNEATSLSNIRALVKRLRKKIGKEEITTVVNIGYRL